MNLMSCRADMARIEQWHAIKHPFNQEQSVLSINRTCKLVTGDVRVHNLVRTVPRATQSVGHHHIRTWP